MDTLNWISLRSLCEDNDALYEWVCTRITNDYSWGDVDHALVLREALGFTITRRRHDRNRDDGLTVEIDKMLERLWDLPKSTFVSL